jgi:c-di-GMP-related signal transduction protein
MGYPDNKSPLSFLTSFLALVCFSILNSSFSAVVQKSFNHRGHRVTQRKSETFRCLGVLIEGLVTLLPATSTVVQVLETVAADPDVVAACRSLKDAGYMIALDDYVANDPHEELVEIADIIKVEMQLTTEEQRTALMKRLGAGHCRMLAEKSKRRESLYAHGIRDLCISRDIFSAVRK